MLVLYLMAIVVGFGAMVFASRRAVDAATELAATTNIPPFFVGITLLAIGTDLPEIANSIAASLTDHGDVNVGDSIGSAATQVTLVLGLLPFIAGPLKVPRSGVTATALLTAGSLVAVAILLSDGNIGRIDSSILFAAFAIGSWIVYRDSLPNQQLALPVQSGPRSALVTAALVALAVVAGAALVALWGIVGLAEILEAPEFLVGFFVASFGTSLPELVFDVTAIRRGAVALAIGDVVGSSFVDSTVSVASGPLLAPTDVTADLAVRGSLLAAAAVLAMAALMRYVDQHDWRSGVILLGVYGAFFVVML